jgi:hypothetical protein
MIGRPYSTADIGTFGQRIRINSNISLIGAQVGLLFYNNPSFTSINLKIYSDSASSTPGKLIHTSTNSWTKAQLQTLDHAYKNIGFTFSKPLLKNNLFYHFVLDAVAYTGNDSAHIAWRISYPDPQYTTGLTLDAAHGDNHPFELSLVGDELQ